MHTDIALELRGISKSFGAVQALRGVDLELRAGEIHALAGENGAGKSTLMKVIDGIVTPNAGEIHLFGEPTRIASPARAQALGIGLVHQEIALCPDVSVAENISMALTSAERAPLMNFRRLRERAERILQQLHPVPVRARAGDLSISDQQVVEIAKALTLDCRILILDEPTAALTDTETANLFSILRELRAQGIAIIYISHRMAEIFELCDRATVLRDGQYVGTCRIADSSPDELVAMMVGRELGDLFPPKGADVPGDPLLEVNGLSDGGCVRDVSLTLRAGEIVGLGGLIGSGRTETACSICGLGPRVSGSVRVAGRELRPGRYSDSIRAGLVYLSEDRKGQGLFLDMPVAANVSALAPAQVSTRLGMIDRRREREQAVRLGERLHLKAGAPQDPVSALSGGNQQKVALAKLLSVDPSVVILDEPTRGVDVGAKSEIHHMLRNLATRGIGVLVISSELPELIGLCDRVLVVHEGTIAGEVSADALSEERIMRLASGLGAHEAETAGEAMQ